MDSLVHEAAALNKGSDPVFLAKYITANIRFILLHETGHALIDLLELPAPMKLAAKLSHYVLYALMLAMPILGWGMLSAAAYPVQVLGVTLPAILPQSDALHTVLWNAHRTLAFAFFAVILVHISAGLFHALVRRDGVFESMAPVPTSGGVAEPAE